MKVTPSFEIQECCPEENTLYYNVRLFFEMESGISFTLEFDQEVDWDRLYSFDECEYQEGQLRGRKKHKLVKDPNFSITKKNGTFTFWLPTNFSDSDSMASTTVSVPASVFMPQIENILKFEKSHTGGETCLACYLFEQEPDIPEKETN